MQPWLTHASNGKGWIRHDTEAFLVINTRLEHLHEHMSKSQDRRIGVSCDLLIASCFVGTFDQQALLEPGSAPDESDEVGCVDGTPPLLGGLDELERHRHAGRPRSGPLGDPLPKADGGEGRLD